MASIIKFVRSSHRLSIIPRNEFSFNIVRTAVKHSDWKPGPFPKTEEEKIKAAKKYNLHPDEYVPYPDNDPLGLCIGDYPVLPEKGYAVKDPYYPYDMPEDRRNYNETLPENFMDLGPERLSRTGERQRITAKEAFYTFGGLMAIMVFLFWLGEHYKFFLPLTKKQYPSPNEKHYTFEPNN